jgi:dephospho-CoA kinase
MFANKPIIGIIGGIGSGKSFVANLFGQLGCLVLNSDDQVSVAYQLPEVQATLRSWFGPSIFDSDGKLNRKSLAAIVFRDPAQLRRLEGLLHPLVGQLRDRAMAAHAHDPQVLAYIWDTPLLLEADLARHCDAIVFVDAPPEIRLRRVQSTRHWSEREWLEREKSQLPLDNKRKIAKYIIRNAADADDEVRSQVREVFSRILAEVRRQTG